MEYLLTMENLKLEKFYLLGGTPIDIYDGIVDVIIKLENDDVEYWLEAATPQSFLSYMNKDRTLVNITNFSKVD